MKIVKEEIIYNNRFIIEQAIISNKDEQFTRIRLNREDAAVVFILNTDTNKVVLTKQFRYAIAAKTNEHILEVVAGKLDKNEDALTAAIRETEEEAGYRIKPQNIRLVNSFFVSPGYTSEKFYFFMATVTNSDKVNKGGGLDSENENIEVVEIDANEFISKIKNGEIHDAKTYIAGLHFILND